MNFKFTNQIEPVHVGGIETDNKYKYILGADCPKSYSNAMCKYFKDVKIGVLSMFDNYTEHQCILKT